MGQFAPHLFDDIKSEPVSAPTLTSYLRVAYKAIVMANRPLKTAEILAIAHDFEFLPSHLYGETPEKTLNARLSEHINSSNRRALFYRTAPATYFLTDRAESTGFKKFKGIQRSKILKNERVLVAPSEKLKERISGKFVSFDKDLFRSVFNDICYFMPRHAAEQTSEVKQFVTFSVIRSGGRYLIYRRGLYSTASTRLQGSLSIGFGGHVADEDFTLFEQNEEALLANSSREILEEIYISQDYRDLSQVSQDSEILGFINVDSSYDAKKHLACVVVFNYDSDSEPGKNELSINGLSWKTLEQLYDNYPMFDHWSKIIIRNMDRMGLVKNGNRR